MFGKKSLIAGFEMPSMSNQVKTVKEKIAKVNNPKPTKTVTRTAPSKSASIQDKLRVIIEEVETHLGKFRPNTIVIRTADQLEEYISSCEKNGIVAVDTETNNSLDPITCDIMGLCLYTPGNKAAYVPVNHANYLTEVRMPNQLTEEELSPFVKRLDKLKIIMHHAKFDMKVIKFTLGVDLPCHWDTMIGTRILNENEKSAGLKDQYVDKIDPSSGSYNIETFFKGVKYAQVDPDIFALYAATDSYCTYKLYEYQKEQFELPGNESLYDLFKNVEMKVVPITCAMEATGVAVDFDFAKKLSVKYHAQLDSIQAELDDLLSEIQPQIDAYKRQNPAHKLSDPISLNSPTQLAILLYDILKVPPVDKEKPRGTGEEMLKKINLPICQKILDFRELNKLLTTYIDKLPESVNPKTKRIHASFNQLGADTGRFSSNNPNLQNIPSHNKECRMLFIPTKGYKIIGGDFSQQEPRLLANYSKDEAMIEAYNQGKDLYATVAAKVYGNDYWDNMEKHQDGSANPEGKKRRGYMKSVVLAIMYGMGPGTLADIIKKPIDEAQEIIASFYEGFPKVKKWIDKTTEDARSNGYVEDLWGRRRRLPILLKPKYEVSASSDSVNENPLFDIDPIYLNRDVSKEDKFTNLLNNAKYRKDIEDIKAQAVKEGVTIKDNSYQRAQAERQAVNARVQGGAATMSKRAMVLVHNDEKLNKMGFRLLLAVHDELIGEAPQEYAEEASKRLSELMIQSALPECTVKMKCDTYLVSRWYEDDFSDTIESDYHKLLDKGMSVEEARAKMFEINDIINPQYLEEMISGTYVCGKYEDI